RWWVLSKPRCCLVSWKVTSSDHRAANKARGAAHRQHDASGPEIKLISNPTKPHCRFRNAEYPLKKRAPSSNKVGYRHESGDASKSGVNRTTRGRRSPRAGG